MQKLAAFIAKQLHIESDTIERAALLAKADLTTHMVNEFPELQGVMGYYYALADREIPEIALAIKEHYAPRFSGDDLPTSLAGQIIALTDKLDQLVGYFGLHLIPKGDKDPYALRPTLCVVLL
jgi:glycyl-tRNA synthetase beta chain